MKAKLLIFGGTTEGRALALACSRQGREAVVCTATGYGQELVEALPHVTVHSGRMDALAMAAFIQNGEFGAVVDATHPYAIEVTDNIQKACAGAGCRYVQVHREDTAGPEGSEGIHSVPDVAGAVAYLAVTTGNILLTTGSKTLEAFCALPGFQERLFARVLPDAATIAHCNALELHGKNIIAMQGPFSHDLNAALLRQLDCRFLVSKKSGREGGLESKLSAARQVGVEVVLIRRSSPETGCPLAEVLRLLGLTS